MNMIMQLQNASAKSTTPLVFQGYAYTNQATTNQFAIIECTQLPYEPKRSPRTGKLSVSAATYLKEKSNANYHAAMEKARAALADDYRDVLPNDLTALRLKRGLSQTSLASTIGTSQSHVAKIEAGLLDVKFSTAVKIADALAVSLDTLRPLITLSKPDTSELRLIVS